MAESYSHEVSSCGFWPGNGGYGRAAFFVYAYPEPAGYGDTQVSTTDAFYDKNLGQFILPYDAVCASSDPDALLLRFCRKPLAAADYAPNGMHRAGWRARLKRNAACDGSDARERHVTLHTAAQKRPAMETGTDVIHALTVWREAAVVNLRDVVEAQWRSEACFIVRQISFTPSNQGH
jgi:hypothetical protein